MNMKFNLWQFLCKERIQESTYKYINSFWCILIIVCCFCLFVFLNTIPCHEYSIDFAYVPTDSNYNFKIDQKIHINSVEGQLIKGEPFLRWEVKKIDSLNNSKETRDSSLLLLRREIKKQKPEIYDRAFGDLESDTTVKAVGSFSASCTNTNIGTGERIFNFITHCFVKCGNLFSPVEERTKVQGGYKSIENPSMTLKESQEGTPFYSFTTSTCFQNWPICNKISPKVFWFSPLDISQSYYKIKINKNRFSEYINVVDSTSTLKIEFNTMVELSPIYPQPDIIASNYIKYNDYSKIKEIYDNGIEFHAKYPEKTNVQSIRLFTITTILVFAMNSLIAYFILFIKTRRKKTVK